MRYRKLTNDGDYSFGNNANDFYVDNDALAQAIKTRILLFYQEWWEDLNNGIPMFQNIIGQVNADNVNLALQGLLTKRIREFTQVNEIKYTKVNIESKYRTLELEIECKLYDESSIQIEIAF